MAITDSVGLARHTPHDAPRDAGGESRRFVSQRLSLEELEARSNDFDRAVDSSLGIDHFCSRSDWVIPYHCAFAPERVLRVYASEPAGRSGAFAAFAEREHPALGPFLEPLENMWGFACPLVGEGSAELLVRVLERDAPEASLLVLGLPTRGQPTGGLLGALRGRGVRELRPTPRFAASLEGGLDGWLSRRSRGFRKSLRKAERRAGEAGIVFERISPEPDVVADLHARILAIEAQSWKSAEGSGVDRPPMRDFYAAMLPRLARRGALRVLIARLGERDVGYAHGGTILASGRSSFRGLQMSFDRNLAHLSLGNLLQRELIAWVCEEGCESYDLGTSAPPREPGAAPDSGGYKARWAERGLVTGALLFQPRRP